MPSFWTLAGQFVVTLHWCLYSYACFGWIGFHTVSCGSYLFFSLIYIVSGVLSDFPGRNYPHYHVHPSYHAYFILPILWPNYSALGFKHVIVQSLALCREIMCPLNTIELQLNVTGFLYKSSCMVIVRKRLSDRCWSLIRGLVWRF